MPSKDLDVKNDAPIDPYRDMDLLERPFGHAFRNSHYLKVQKRRFPHFVISNLKVICNKRINEI